MGYDMEGDQKRSTVLQIILGLIAYFISVAPSMSIGFSAVALPPLLNSENPQMLTISQASWFASIASVATPVGCFLSGPISDRFGRKAILLWINVVTFAGWMVIALAYNMESGQYPVLLIGRILTGLSTGLASMPASVYMAEVSSANLRGMFTTASAIFFALGILIVYVLGYIFENDWGTIAGITAIIPCCSLVIGFLYLPESPSWLVSKDRVEDATKNMCKIYGYKKPNQEVLDDIAGLVRNRDSSKLISTKPADKTMCTSLAKKMRYLRRPTCFKPFILMLAYFFFQQFSGTFVIVFYAIDIVSVAEVSIDPYKAIVMIAFTRFAAAILVSYVSRKYGRRPPSILSGVGTTVCMLVLAVYLYLKHLGSISQTTVDSLSWLPLTSLILYFFTSTLGFLTIPFAMAAECFPAKIRGLASGLITCIAYIFNFIIVKIFPAMLEGMSAHGLFFFYGMISLAGTVFIVTLLPETKGKTLAEIEEYFGKKRSVRRKPIIINEDVLEKDRMLSA